MVATELQLLLVWYVIACLVVTVTAQNRGHHFGPVLLTCLFATPLVGAILFHAKAK